MPFTVAMAVNAFVSGLSALTGGSIDVPDVPTIPPLPSLPPFPNIDWNVRWQSFIALRFTHLIVASYHRRRYRNGSTSISICLIRSVRV